MTMEAYGRPENLSTPHEESSVTRRGFLDCSLRAALAAALLPAGRLLGATAGVATAPASGGSRVVRMASERVIEGLQIRSIRLRRLIEEGLCRLTGASSPAAAWAALVRPGRKVLIKATKLPGTALGIEGAVLAVVLDSLTRAGHRLGDIVVAGCDVPPTIEGLAPMPRGWSSRTVAVGGAHQQIRRYLEDVDVVINLPSLTDHNVAGLACAMMNVTLPYIRRPGRVLNDGVHEAIVKLYAATDVLPRPAVTIVNALRCVIEGGPIVADEHLVVGREVWLATDPVAVDRVALQWLHQQRTPRGLPPLATTRPARYVSMASAAGLGHGDLRNVRIETHPG
ncbi:MAG: DUF362 domain-containing protein [Planctomycetota bacterium]